LDWVFDGDAVGGSMAPGSDGVGNPLTVIFRLWKTAGRRGAV